DGLVGKSTTQVGINAQGVFVSSDAEVHDKWTQALSSLDELVSASAWYKDDYEVNLFSTILLPILVVPKGTLWAADYDTTGKLTATPQCVDEATIFMGRDYWGTGYSYNVSH